jgi:phage terminase small subunit
METTMTEPLATSEDTLTYRQLRFIFEYLIDQNASAAAVRAGYSEKSRASTANELMNNPAVQARLREEMQSLLAEARCTALDLMKERMRAAFFRAEKMFSKGWEMRALEEMEQETRDALEVRSVSRKSGPVLHIRQPDRDKALRALEKVHERLERLNEKYWARLEKEGKVKSLAEIEAMDGGGAELAEPADARAGTGAGGSANFSAMSMVFSGSAVDARPGPAQTRGGTGKLASGTARLHAGFSAKPYGFLGLAAGAGAPGYVFPAKTMIFSGCAEMVGSERPGLPRPMTSPCVLGGRAAQRVPAFA